jgi:outer membrane protein W
MKKISFALACVVASFLGNAQSTVYKPFKVDLGVGYAVPGGKGAKGGVLFAIEPKFAITDNITAGLRLEAAVMAQAQLDQTSGELKSGSVKANASYVAMGDYYFTTTTFRPFAGIGAGLYSVASADIENETGDVATGKKFGFVPRAGFEVGHFRTAIEYNFVGKTAGINNNYLGVKFSFFIGGGRASN